MTKKELRKIYSEKRTRLSPSVCEQYNLQIYNYFFASLDLSFIKVLHTYLPIKKNNEPDTWMIVDRIRREFPWIQISLPKVGVDGNLENFYFEGLHQLQNNNWGIPEPRQGVPAPVEKIDLVIVPLLAFDNTGHRVGYGKGYYDRLLQRCRADCKKIGISFFDAVEKIDDVDSQDFQLNVCITPKGVISF
ncbi:MAG TPA: 5-formyltetrahydrofolate cyclo-ligase [Cyclobacteriaceae bacterium]|nr:5-formyltetrahydrofolate cyclo-ligase [Cyclobacteriaceae bacterium]